MIYDLGFRRGKIHGLSWAKGRGLSQTDGAGLMCVRSGYEPDLCKMDVGRYGRRMRRPYGEGKIDFMIFPSQTLSTCYRPSYSHYTRKS